MLIVDVIRSIRAFCRGSTPAFDASSLHFLPRRRFGFRWFFSAIRSSTRIRINFVFQEQSFARVAQHVLSERVERAQSLLHRRVRKDFVNKTSGGGDQRRTADERKPTKTRRKKHRCWKRRRRRRRDTFHPALMGPKTSRIDIDWKKEKNTNTLYLNGRV